MEHTIPVPRAAGDEAAFEHERLDVYQVALEFQSIVPRLVPRRGFAALRDQLDRASSSVLLNIAEGCGRFARAEKAHFYLIARGSAMESAAASMCCSPAPCWLRPATATRVGCWCA